MGFLSPLMAVRRPRRFGTVLCTSFRQPVSVGAGGGGVKFLLPGH